MDVNLGRGAAGDLEEPGVLPWVEALESTEREPLGAGTSALEEAGAGEVVRPAIRGEMA